MIEEKDIQATETTGIFFSSNDSQMKQRKGKAREETDIRNCDSVKTKRFISLNGLVQEMQTHAHE